jgi:hypothetical protein
MPFEFIQIPANGQGAAAETLNALQARPAPVAPRTRL